MCMCVCVCIYIYIERERGGGRERNGFEKEIEKNTELLRNSTRKKI